MYARAFTDWGKGTGRHPAPRYFCKILSQWKGLKW